MRNPVLHVEKAKHEAAQFNLPDGYEVTGDLRLRFVEAWNTHAAYRGPWSLAFVDRLEAAGMTGDEIEELVRMVLSSDHGTYDLFAAEAQRRIVDRTTDGPSR